MSEPGKAVFLSYAREDADAARRIADALRSHGVEVWFDQSELRGGDAWDAKIRKQIKECALFLAVISRHTDTRLEGYFRREWKQAIDRTHDIAEEKAFLLPVVIDDTPDSTTHVPAKFHDVQWTRLTSGEPTAEFVEQVGVLLGLESGAGVSPVEKRAESRSPLSGFYGRDARATPSRQTLPRWVGAALAVVALAIASWKFLPRATPATANSKSQSPATSSSVAVKPLPDLAPAKSVAVLAFENMSADKDTEYFSDGVTEEILNALSRNSALQVAARTSSFSFKGKNVAIEEIGRALHVASVIEGSVRRSGNRVRITVQLIKAADGYHVWSETFEREMTDIFALQDEIAAKVAEKLAGGPAAPVTSIATNAATPTKNLAAYDAYLRGRAAQTKGRSPALVDEATHHYEEAVRLDPRYAFVANYAGWSNADYDRAFASSEHSSTDAERTAAFDRMETLIAAEMPYVPLYHPHQVHLVHPAVHGWRDNPFGMTDWRELWLEAPK